MKGVILLMKIFLVLGYCCFMPNTMMGFEYYQSINESLSDSINIVSNGKSNYVIIKSPNSRPYEDWGADQLQIYIKRSTGAEIPITNTMDNKLKKIIIGDKEAILSIDHAFNFSALGNEGFKIEVVGENVIIGANTISGTLYGICSFLEHYLGVRCWTDKDFYIPLKPDFRISANLSDQQLPSFTYRRTITRYTTRFPYNWWHKASDEPYDLPKQFNSQVLSLTKFGFFVHTANLLVPPSRYFPVNPEYFACYGGKRTSQQLCFTNPGTIKLIQQNIDSLIRINPQYKYWGISANDVRIFCEGNCHDPNDHCKEFIGHGGESEIMMRLVNSIASAHPGKRFIYLAYGATLQVPETHPVSNVTVMLAIYNGDNRKDKSILDNPQVRALISEWKAVSDQIIYYDYYADFQSGLTPLPNLYFIQPNLKFLQKEGIEMIVNEAWKFDYGELGELRSYLLTELSWNVNFDVNKAILDFLYKFYGPAGAFMKKYIDAINEQVQADSKLGKRLYIIYNADFYANGFLSVTNIKKYEEILNNAEEAVRNDTIYFKRVQKEKMCLTYAELEVRKKNLTGDNGFFNLSNDKKYVLKPEVKVKMNELLKFMDSLDAFYLDYSKTTPVDYKREMTNFIKKYVGTCLNCLNP